MTYVSEFDIPRERKSLVRRPVTFDHPPESGEKPNVTPRPEHPRGPPRIGRLESLSDWKKQIGKVYRMVRRGELPSAEGSRLVFILTSGAQITREEARQKHEEEQRAQVERLQQQLEALQGKGQQPLLPAPSELVTLPEWAKEDP
jgi:polyhydroxyalkanoate synthesis regulator phasin